MARAPELLDVTIQAIKSFDGEAQLEEIYDWVKFKSTLDVTIWGDFKASIRDAIETRSSDSERFRGKDDLFYKVPNSRGWWGMRKTTG